jgi:hypothetical protein
MFPLMDAKRVQALSSMEDGTKQKSGKSRACKIVFVWGVGYVKFVDTLTVVGARAGTTPR